MPIEDLAGPPERKELQMGQLDKDGILTLQELMITALATADVVAKLLIEKGLITQKELDVRLFSERAHYQSILQRAGGTSVDA
jgi:hypothetical protein